MCNLVWYILVESTEGSHYKRKHGILKRQWSKHTNNIWAWSGKEEKRICEDILKKRTINHCKNQLKSNQLSCYPFGFSYRQPYKKSNDDPMYIDKKSNRPTSIMQIPKSISKRISDIPLNESIFNQWIPYYENALKKSGYSLSLKCTLAQDQNENNPQREQRNWKNVKKNIEKLFPKLLDHHFSILWNLCNFTKYLTTIQ